MKPHYTRLTLLSTLLLAAPIAGCAQDQFDDSDEIASAISQENGGLDMQDEAPMFGEPDLFAEANLDAEVVFEDNMQEQAEVVAMQQDEGAAVVHTVLRWGQIPFDPDATEVVDWTGTLRVNRGAILIRRAVAFEDALGDGIEQRESPRALSFRSTTRPASDGLRLTLIDPTPDAAEPFVLDYSTADGSVYSVELADLVAAPQSFDVDDAGNRIVAVAISRSEEECDSGTLGGRWHRVARDRGRLVGQVRDADGEVAGHMRGVYGQRDNGNRVVFGKFVSRTGEFRGIFAGRYAAGHFGGLWMTRAGEVGALGGRYRETLAGPRVGGHFLGRWAERRCNVSVDSGGDLPSI
jgi:hypothetical protein